MNKMRMKKYTTVTTASILVLQLGACTTMEDKMDEISEQQFEEIARQEEQQASIEQEIVPVVPDDMTPEEYATALVAENNINVYDSDMANACDEWIESEDGSFRCIDEDSEYYSQHFFNGVMFATLGALVSSTIYKSQNLKDGERKSQIIKSAVVSPTNTRVSKGTGASSSNSKGKASYSSGKSGFGSGGASRGGSASS